MHFDPLNSVLSSSFHGFDVLFAGGGGAPAALAPGLAGAAHCAEGRGGGLGAPKGRRHGSAAPCLGRGLRAVEAPKS